MGTISQENFLVSFADEVTRLTSHFVQDGYHALATSLKAPLGSAIVLYIVLMGYAIIRGIVDKPQQELWKFAFRVGVIYMLAMNWDFFAGHLRDFFVSGSETLASTMMQSVGKGASGSINQSLQNVLNEVMALGSALFEAGSFRKLTPYFAGVMVFLSGCATVGLAFIEIITARFMLSLALCTAPIFVIFILFDQTKSLFERWLGMLVSYSLVLILVSAVTGFCVHLIHWVTAMALSDTAPTAAIWIPLFMTSCLCVMTVSQAASMGRSIGGAFQAAGGGAMVAGLAAGAAGAMSRAGTAFNDSRQIAGKGFGMAARVLETATSNRFTAQRQKNMRGGKS